MGSLLAILFGLAMVSVRHYLVRPAGRYTAIGKQHQSRIRKPTKIR
jgi:hypothetical protein